MIKPGESHEQCVKRHCALVGRVVKRMLEQSLAISAEKSVLCGFCVKSTTYLGFVLSRDGISIDKQKQSTVLDAPFPTIANEGTAAPASRCSRVAIPSTTAISGGAQRQGAN